MVLSVPQVAGLDAILTPALVVDLDAVRQNIAVTLRLLGGDPNRWRPHLKTAKLGLIMRTIREQGVAQAKCSTTLELETACEAGFQDLLLARALFTALVAGIVLLTSASVAAALNRFSPGRSIISSVSTRPAPTPCCSSVPSTSFRAGSARSTAAAT